MIGQRFTRMVITGMARVGKRSAAQCRCDCGAERVVAINDLRRGFVKSCGCLKRERTIAYNRVHKRTHGCSGSSLYGIWQNMIARCTDPTRPAWPDYGGRGIRVCDGWLASVEAFIADVGERPSPRHTLDRVDNDGNYEPSNVRWALRSDQNKNSRHVRWRVTINGETRLLSDWAPVFGVELGTVRGRLRRGGDPLRALTTPALPWRAPRSAAAGGVQ